MAVTLSIDVDLRLGAFVLGARFQSDAGVTALFGRSGSGKTTLINAIAGLVRPDRGRIVVSGRVLFDSDAGTDVPVHRRRVGYVFQEGRLLPHLDVHRNLTYGERLVAPGERYVQFDHVVDLLGLGHLLGRRPAALSGGERQRVALGRALLASPLLLLMDEPLAALDDERKSEILGYIERLHAEVAVPIVYVSHSVEEVVRLADQVALMANGVVAAFGSVAEVMGRPELRAQGVRFEGGTVIQAEVAGHDQEFGATRLRFGGGELIATGIDAAVGTSLRVRIRARDVALALDPPQRATFQNVLPGILTRIRMDQGAVAELEIDVNGTMLRARVARRAVAQLGLVSGQAVFALIRAVSLDHSAGGRG